MNEDADESETEKVFGSDLMKAMVVWADHWSLITEIERSGEEIAIVVTDLFARSEARLLTSGPNDQWLVRSESIPVDSEEFEEVLKIITRGLDEENGGEILPVQIAREICAFFKAK